jgi:hypothetical protein
MAELPIVTPIIHLNGDRKETLIENLERCYCAVSDAIEALRRCAGNGRNFYPEPGRLERYEAQHMLRMEHLMAVYRSIEAEAIAIDQENPTR